MPETPQIAFIGTGNMGRPMIMELLKKGYPVKVYDKFREAAEPVVAAGAIWTNTPKETAIGSDVVITCLPLPTHVREVIVGEQGALEGMAPGTTWIDLSTTDYHNTLYVAGVAKEKGVFSLETPVSNLSHMGVDFANSSIYAAGDQAVYEKIQPVLNTIGQISFYVGEIGTAQAVKLLTNLLFYVSTAICGECLAIAQEAEIPLHWMWWEHMPNSQGHSVVSEQVMPFLLDGSYDRSCSLEIGVKDMGLTVKLADELGVALPLGRIVNEQFVEAGRRYDPQDRHLKVCKVTEDGNNLPLRIPDFTAPSKYGANPDYVRSEKMMTDSYGRSKPEVPDAYASTPYQPTDSQLDLAQTLTGFMAYTNHIALEEAYALGQSRGLSQKTVADCILWSVGTCWVADNYGSYQPESSILDKMAAIDTKLTLPTTTKILSLLRG
ncbi:MAG: NAD(P)-dependent oxidoreductase [Chloroflexota bacterium]